MQTNFVIFKASHELVSCDTVGAEEVGTVATACDRLLLRLAARANHASISDISHVHHVHHYEVDRQLVDGPRSRLLLTLRTRDDTHAPVIFSGPC